MIHSAKSTYITYSVYTMACAIQTMFEFYTLAHGYKPEYGTAGFRTHANNLDSTVFRCGILMALKAQLCKNNCGIMITASHNPECDNGVKLVDYNGEMLDKQWQIYAIRVAQAVTFQEFQTVIREISVMSDEFDSVHSAKVFIGIDTRESGKHLSQICCDGITSVGGLPCMIGEVTTPELHYNVLQSNRQHIYPSYTEHLMCWFKVLSKNKILKQTLHVDCANGVGSLRLQELQPELSKMGVDLVLYNTGGGMLNHECGADFVEKQNTFPCGMSNIENFTQCCSLDGDADRIVYFSKVNGKFQLINGDKIACLLAEHLANAAPKCFSTGLIQTAYSNGASTNYILDNHSNISLECTHTGVQYLHKEAHKYDIGIYFEANGHGTVLFSKQAQKNTHLFHLSQLLSQVVGDAIGNLLVIQYLLSDKCLSDWIDMYSDLYTKQDKLYVNKDAFETTDFGRVLVSPIGLQDAINSTLEQYMSARAFLRPSGTENIVRLYIESKDYNTLENIASDIKRHVKCMVL